MLWVLAVNAQELDAVAARIWEGESNQTSQYRAQVEMGCQPAKAAYYSSYHLAYSLLIRMLLMLMLPVVGNNKWPAYNKADQ